MASMLAVESLNCHATRGISTRDDGGMTSSGAPPRGNQNAEPVNATSESMRSRALRPSKMGCSDRPDRRV